MTVPQNASRNCTGFPLNRESTQDLANNSQGTIWLSSQVHTGANKDQDTLQTFKIWMFRKTLVHTKHTEGNIHLKVIQLCHSSTMEPPITAPLG